MKKFFTEFKFYESYSFAQAINNILYNQFTYLRGLNDFYGDDSFLTFIKPFPKYSALHHFIEFIVDENIHSENCEVNLEERKNEIRRFNGISTIDRHPQKLPINEAFDFYGIKHTSFIEWLNDNGKTDFLAAGEDDIYEYLTELRLIGEYDLLLEKIIQEVFFILFQNRQLLLVFNDMMARQINRSELSEIPNEYSILFSKSGSLKRTNIPQWVKRAVYFRDRGMCVICRRDLSGVLSISNSEQFDHIVPLAEGGLNDVTNIQLLCKECNLKKLHYEAVTSEHYETWYSI